MSSPTFSKSPPAWLVAVLVVVFVGWGLNYIFHTSVEVTRPDGGTQRAFVLWDDGMVSMTYARNLARGDGLVWNPGEEAVQGFSNLLVTLFMAALHLMPIGPFYISLVFQIGCLILLFAALWMAYRLARALLPDDPWAALVAAISVGLYAPLGVWGLQGSDVAPATLIALWAFVMVAERRAEPSLERWPPWLFTLLAVGILLRPDMTLLFVLFLGYGFITGLASRSQSLRGLAVLASVWAGLLSLGYFYYGDFLPNTYYLKATGSPRDLMIVNGLTQVWEIIGWAGLPFLLLGLVSLLVFLRSDSLALLGAATVAIFFGYTVWIGGDWAHEYHPRFVVPAIALFLVIFAVAMRSCLARLMGAGAVLRPLGRVAVMVFGLAGLGAFFPGLAMEEWWVRLDETMYRRMNRMNIELALYLKEATVPGTSVAYHWAGSPRYFSERPGVDVLGKSDRHIAKMSVDRFIPAHSKWDWAYVAGERQPDVIPRASRGLNQEPTFYRNYVLVRSGRKPDDTPFSVHRRAIEALVGDDFSFFALPSGEPIARPALNGY